MTTNTQDSHSRFTNIEAGLKMGADMLEDVSAENKYMIFLSDGFPTTYISGGYNGYDPYCTAGDTGRRRCVLRRCDRKILQIRNKLQQ